MASSKLSQRSNHYYLGTFQKRRQSPRRNENVWLLSEITDSLQIMQKLVT